MFSGLTSDDLGRRNGHLRRRNGHLGRKAQKSHQYAGSFCSARPTRFAAVSPDNAAPPLVAPTVELAPWGSMMWAPRLGLSACVVSLACWVAAFELDDDVSAGGRGCGGKTTASRHRRAVDHRAWLPVTVYARVGHSAGSRLRDSRPVASRPARSSASSAISDTFGDARRRPRASTAPWMAARRVRRSSLRTRIRRRWRMARSNGRQPWSRQAMVRSSKSIRVVIGATLAIPACPGPAFDEHQRQLRVAGVHHRHPVQDRGATGARAASHGDPGRPVGPPDPRTIPA